MPARERLVRDRPHTQIKLGAYQIYLPEWLKILGQLRSVSDLYVLDMFAGPGEYADGVAGSPVIAADAAIVVQDYIAEHQKRDVRVHLRLVEKDDATQELLANAMARYQGRLDYKVLGGSALENAPALLAESRGSPTLALLDPDGIEIPFDLVRQFGHRPRTEVLLSFDVQGLLRSPPRARSRFMGDDVSWRRCYAADGSLDPDALLELYRRALAADGLFHYTAVHRIVFTQMHANRAIAQGCGSTKGTEKLLEAFRTAASRFDARLVEAASYVERRAKVNRAIDLLRPLAGAIGISYGGIYEHLGGLNLGHRDSHQVLLFLKERGVASWTSRLHGEADPPPKIAFAPVFPSGLAWDGVERSPEMPELRIAAWPKTL